MCPETIMCLRALVTSYLDWRWWKWISFHVHGPPAVQGFCPSSWLIVCLWHSSVDKQHDFIDLLICLHPYKWWITYIRSARLIWCRELMTWSPSRIDLIVYISSKDNCLLCPCSSKKDCILLLIIEESVDLVERQRTDHLLSIWTDWWHPVNRKQVLSTSYYNISIIFLFIYNCVYIILYPVNNSSKQDIYSQIMIVYCCK